MSSLIYNITLCTGPFLFLKPCREFLSPESPLPGSSPSSSRSLAKSPFVRRPGGSTVLAATPNPPARLRWMLCADLPPPWSHRDDVALSWRE